MIPSSHVPPRWIRASRSVIWGPMVVLLVLRILPFVSQAMLAHTQQEFEASIKMGEANADDLGAKAWLPAVLAPSSSDSSYTSRYWINAATLPRDRNKWHDFEKDSWGMHAIQFQGQPIPFLAVKCSTTERMNKHTAFLKVAGAIGAKTKGHRPNNTLVRSLGYAGSFFKQFSSAALLLKMRPKIHDLVQLIAAPSSTGGTGGTFVPVKRKRAFKSSPVPINKTQREAISKLKGGLDIIVGPPGECLNHP